MSRFVENYCDKRGKSEAMRFAIAVFIIGVAGDYLIAAILDSCEAVFRTITVVISCTIHRDSRML